MGGVFASITHTDRVQRPTLGPAPWRCVNTLPCRLNHTHYRSDHKRCQTGHESDSNPLWAWRARIYPGTESFTNLMPVGIIQRILPG